MKHWKAALNLEMEGLVRHGLCTQVKRSQNRKVIDTRVVFKWKPGANGEVERYKRRFVAQGFPQAPDLDNNETFAPRPAAASTRIPMAEVAMADMKLYHVNVEQAFKEAKAEKEIFIQLPENFQDFPNAVGKLNRSRYGIVQASRSWNSWLTKLLKNIGFTLSTRMTYPCVLRKLKESELEAIVVAHVDDIFVGTKGMWTTQRFRDALAAKFSI